jgi:hypothetical protein
VKRVLTGTVVAAAAAAVWSAVTHPWGWLYALGVHPYPGPQTPWTYQLWSGFTPALTVLTLFGAVASLYHVHNCHEQGCWRIGRYRVGGTVWCRFHLAAAKPERTEHEVLEAIEANLAELIVLLKAQGG